MDIKDAKFQRVDNKDWSDSAGATSDLSLHRAYISGGMVLSHSVAHLFLAVRAVTPPIAFSVYLDHEQDHVQIDEIIKFNRVILNDGNAYNTTTGKLPYFTLSIRTCSHLNYPGPEVIKLFSCSTQLSMKFALLITLKLLIIANFFLLNIAEHENFSANNYENANYSWHFHIY